MLSGTGVRDSLMTACDAEPGTRRTLWQTT